MASQWSKACRFIGLVYLIFNLWFRVCDHLCKVDYKKAPFLVCDIVENGLITSLVFMWCLLQFSDLILPFLKGYNLKQVSQVFHCLSTRIWGFYSQCSRSLKENLSSQGASSEPQAFPQAFVHDGLSDCRNILRLTFCTLFLLPMHFILLCLP